MCKFEQIDKKYKNIIIDSLESIEKQNINTKFMREMLDITDFNIQKDLVLADKSQKIAGNYSPTPGVLDNNVIYLKASMNVIEEEDSEIVFAHELMHLLATRKIEKIDDRFIVNKGMQKFEVGIKNNNAIIKTDSMDIVLNVALDEAMTEFIRMNITDKEYSKYYRNRYTMLYLALEIILKLLFLEEYKEKAFKIYFENTDILYKELLKYNIIEEKFKNVFSSMLTSLNQGLISIISIMTLTEKFIPFIEEIMDKVKKERNLSKEEINKLAGLKEGESLINKLFDDLLK